MLHFQGSEHIEGCFHRLEHCTRQMCLNSESSRLALLNCITSNYLNYLLPLLYYLYDYVKIFFFFEKYVKIYVILNSLNFIFLVRDILF